MSMVTITLKDGSKREVEKGSSLFDIAKSISGRLAKEAIVGEVNGKVVDLTTKLEEDAEVSILKFDDEEGEHAYRHTSAHIMAQAVQRLFPGTKIAIGPSIKNGFYYDFDSEHVFKPEDLDKIESRNEKDH